MSERGRDAWLVACFGIWSLRKPLELRPLIDERCKGDAAATDDDVDIEICDKAEGFLLKENMIINYFAHVLFPVLVIVSGSEYAGFFHPHALSKNSSARLSFEFFFLLFDFCLREEGPLLIKFLHAWAWLSAVDIGFILFV